jgi:hypothetical protein
LISGILAALLAFLLVVGVSVGAHVNGDLTFGDVVVGVGTLALAALTGALARATAQLDASTAERERTRQQRELRGAVRLLSGELRLAKANVELGLKNGKWSSGLSLPHAVWERHGILIAESLSDDDARSLVTTIASASRFDLVMQARLLAGLGDVEIEEDWRPILQAFVDLASICETALDGLLESG